jgi:hypothetical protein
VARYKISALGKLTRTKPSTLGELNWLIACNGGECIRVAPRGDQIIIGDSKKPGGPVLTYSRAEWHAFVDGIRQGHFDGL